MHNQSLIYKFYALDSNSFYHFNYNGLIIMYKHPNKKVARISKVYTNTYSFELIRGLQIKDCVLKVISTSQNSDMVHDYFERETHDSIFIFAFDKIEKGSEEKSLLKLFNYVNCKFDFLIDHKFSQSIRQIVEVDPINSIFAIVHEEDDGISIIKLEFTTSGYRNNQQSSLSNFKIIDKFQLYKNQGLCIKHVSAINSSTLIIVAERDHGGGFVTSNQSPFSMERSNNSTPVPKAYKS